MSVSISSNQGDGAPELVARVADVMAGYGRPWCLAGGYAVDAWIGRITRDHGDVDVCVPVQDQRAVFEHLRGWQLIAHDFPSPRAESRVEVPGATSRLWDGTRRIETTGHLHARPASDDPIPEILGPENGFWLDILFCDGSAAEWIVSRDPFISVPMVRAVTESAWGVPTASPEVVLFDKSKYMRLRDKLDFMRLRRRLTDEQREWLRDAIKAAGHPWMAVLVGEPAIEPMASSDAAAVPEPVARISDVMAGYGRPWCMCGGWAVEAWLGGADMREHGDVDVSVFAQDQRALFEHLRGWQLVAHDRHVPGNTSELWDGKRQIDLPGHIHGRLHPGSDVPVNLDDPGEQGFGLDIQLNDGSAAEWMVSHDPFLSVPMAQAIAKSPWGVPTATPEVLLFYKSRDLRRRDRTDFARLLPRLTYAQRAWLRHAIERAGHPWVAELAGATRDEAMV